MIRRWSDSCFRFQSNISSFLENVLNVFDSNIEIDHRSTAQADKIEWLNLIVFWLTQQRLATVGSIPTSSRNSMLPGLSRLKAPSCGVLKSSVTNVSSNIIPANSSSKKVDMNATIVVEKPAAANATECRPSSGIPRFSMSKIPGPRTKYSRSFYDF